MATRFWNDDRDARLARMRAAGTTMPEIAAAFDVAESTVARRCRQLDLSRRMPGVTFWTPERDEKLREMWDRTPSLTLAEMAAEFNGEVTSSYISLRGSQLGFPSRYSARPAKYAAKTRSMRSPFAGECPREAVQRPKPRVKTYQRFEPCPYWVIRESRAEPCGVEVDRKPNAHGDRPSPYCCDHRPAVLPLSKGLLGNVPTHSRVPAGLGSNLRRR